MNFPTTEHQDLEKFFETYILKISEGFKSIDTVTLREVSEIFEKVIKNNGKIFTCGNGGSSAISEHLVCDFVKGISTDTNEQPFVYSLTSNVPLLTATANDISYQETFSYQLERYANKEDILLCISSSGNSENIIYAIKKAKKMGLKTVSFVGFDGGLAKKLADYSIHIPIKNYGVVEDIHQSLMHIFAQYIRLSNIDKKVDINKKFF